MLNSYGYPTGKKGQFILTDGGDEQAISRGVYNTYTQRNLRYSQVRFYCQNLHVREIVLS